MKTKMTASKIIAMLEADRKEAEFNRVENAKIGDHARASVWSARYNALDSVLLRIERAHRCGPDCVETVPQHRTPRP